MSGVRAGPTPQPEEASAVRLAPFHAVRYDADVAGPNHQTSAPPYDQLDRVSYAAHRSANPYTILELLAGEDRAGPDAYKPARATLDRWQRTGVLVRDPRRAFYLYEEHELRDGVPTVQRGVVGALDLDDIDEGRLLLHEHVDTHRATGRARRMAAVPLDLTPVVAVHLGGGGDDLAVLLEGARAHPPIIAFTDETTIDHRLWRITDPAAVAGLRAIYSPLRAVLADGHHRVAAARQLRDARRAAGKPMDGWGATTAWLVDAASDGPELRAVHRLVRAAVPKHEDGTPGLSGFRATAWSGGVTGLQRALGDAPGITFGLVDRDGTWLLRAEDPRGLRAVTASTAGMLLAGLDAQLLSTVVLPEMGNPPVEAVFDADAAAKTLPREAPASLLLLRAPTIQQVLQIAEAGGRMPPKTTWFRPKPRAGLIMRRLDDPFHDGGPTAELG